MAPDGRLVLLEDQDRTRWDRGEIEEGIGLVERALRRGRPGPYQVQATIAAIHAQAGTAQQTDWPQIAVMYGRLLAMTPSPVIELNRAVAIAMSGNLEGGLAIVDGLAQSGALASYHLLHSTRADLLRRLGRRAQAGEAYRLALGLATNQVERAFLRRRLAEVTG